MAKRNAGLRLGPQGAGPADEFGGVINHGYLVGLCADARAAVFAAAIELADSRPVAARWTRENCRAWYDARVALDAAVAAYRAARVVCRCHCAEGAPP